MTCHYKSWALKIMNLEINKMVQGLTLIWCCHLSPALTGLCSCHWKMGMEATGRYTAVPCLEVAAGCLTKLFFKTFSYDAEKSLNKCKENETRILVLCTYRLLFISLANEPSTDGRSQERFYGVSSALVLTKRIKVRDICREFINFFSWRKRL